MKLKLGNLLLVLLFIPFIGNAQHKSQKDENGIYSITEEMPEFPGGEEALRVFISNHLKYPEEAKANKISGKVYINFVVDETGKVINPRIARGVDPSLDKEALRVIGLLPQWTPGKDEGKPVKVSYTVPVKFKAE